MKEHEDMQTENFTCPIPARDHKQISLAHGGGGILTHKLIEDIFMAEFKNPALESRHDGALIPGTNGKMVMTTDSHVITPIFFPGGDIGSLAVHGTVNDLAMCGAKPLALSTGFIIEEGFPMDELKTVVRSMKTAADKAGVSIITGDTKVVEKGKADKVFINTTGIGILPEGVNITPKRAAPGDVILLNGTIADHGIAILSRREGLEFATPLKSDSAAVNHLVEKILAECAEDIHVLRDPTRGGLGTTLKEIAAEAGVSIHLDEEKIPVNDEVRGACELLGLDPMFVANEGKFICIAHPSTAEKILEIMKNDPLGKSASIIGEISEEEKGKLFVKSCIGAKREMDMFYGEQLPRIC